MAKMQQIELTIRPKPSECKVVLNGEDISHLVRACTVYVEVNQPTRVLLDCIMPRVSASIVSGYLCDQPNPETDQPNLDPDLDARD